MNDIMMILLNMIYLMIGGFVITFCLEESDCKSVGQITVKSVVIGIFLGADLLFLIRGDTTDVRLIIIALIWFYMVFSVILIKYAEIMNDKVRIVIVLSICFSGIIQWISYDCIIDSILITTGTILFYLMIELYIKVITIFRIQDKINSTVLICFISVLGAIVIANVVTIEKSNPIWNVRYTVEILLSIIITAFFTTIYLHMIKSLTVQTTRISDQWNQIHDQYEIMRIEKMYREARSLRHDVKQCVAITKGFIDEEDYEQAKHFLDKMVEEKVELFGYTKYCKNQVLNYVINDKMEKSRIHQVELKCAVFGKIESINDIDICILVGNLLDNAIEAAEKSIEKQVNLEIYDKHHIEIVIENTLKESVFKRNPEFLTTKKENEHHGIGMKSIREIVHKYHGEITYHEIDRIMNCKVILLNQ